MKAAIGNLEAVTSRIKPKQRVKLCKTKIVVLPAPRFTKDHLKEPEVAGWEHKPSREIGRIRQSTAQLTPRLSTNRAVHEYIDQYYLPPASAYLKRAADKGAPGVDIVNWRHALDQKWAAPRFGKVSFETRAQQHVFEAQLYLSDLRPEAVRVELHADGLTRGPSERCEMVRGRQLARCARRLRTAPLCLRPVRQYGAGDTAPRRRCDPIGRRTNPMAAMMRSPETKL